MPTYSIRGIDVEFPFEAYDCQLAYMEKVIQSLQNKCNALLESPTGTGKTLSILCATLAWRRSLGSFMIGKIERNNHPAGAESDAVLSQSKGTNLPVIIYTSRTHSQLRQVIRELKRSSYRPKMVILGSREQLCIHDEVSLLHGKAQTNACHYLCRRRRCTHHAQATDYVERNPHLGQEPIDIEDLVNIGKKFGPCPYYLSRELHKTVDILFAPYNYLIDQRYRKSLTINLTDSILIFDEAHNLENLCSDAASFELPSGLLTACISETKSCIDLAASRGELNHKSQNPENFAILRALLLKLEKLIAELPIESKELGFTKPGPYIYQLLADLNITHKTSSKLIGIIDEAVVLLEEDKHNREKGACRLESFGDILGIIFREEGNAHANFYRVHVQENGASTLDGYKGRPSRTLSWWCFNPGIAMEYLSKVGVGSMILTSGTLSPLDSLAHELRLDFPILLENPHVITSKQIWAGVLPVGPSGRSFNSSYRNRDSLDYKQDLGNAIVNFARIVPGGLLVFFPSYYLLEQSIECWKNMCHANSTSIWERICKHKKPVVEPRQSSLFPTAIKDYITKLTDTSTSGAVFFAVCRGKVSEGLDFTDHAGRAVVITGMPFSLRADPKIRLKREYLDQEVCLQRKGCKILTGDEWYNQQASRAVNQAIGRVIRHQHDYGSIILCDERFSSSNYLSRISLWIRPHIKCYSNFGDAVFTLSHFFRNDNAHDPSSKQEILKGSVQLSDVIPANRSSFSRLSEDQDFKLKYLCENKLAPFAQQNAHLQNIDMSRLPAKSCVIEVGEELVESCSTTKHKLCINDVQIAVKKSCSNGLRSASTIMLDKQPGPSRVPQNAQITVSLSCEDRDGTASSEGAQATSFSMHGASEEARGSAFLTQVKQRLSSEEYKQFVGFMKALKSKAMKMDRVLRSIVALFSGPERQPLRLRFKEYVPAKFHSTYELYLEEVA